MPYIIGGVVLLIVLAAAGFYLARIMKGKVTLDLPRDSFATGDTITGKVRLELKRASTGMLKASLIGREERRTQRGKNPRTEWVEVYRDDQVLEEETDFDAGFAGSYRFEIVAPTAAEARSAGGATWAAVRHAAGSSMLGAMAGMAAELATGAGRMKWHVEARLDAKGVDLVASRNVKVRLTDAATAAG